MRIRITIDTDDAADEAALETDTPFALRVYQDDPDGTPSNQPLLIGTETALLGNEIPKMLSFLSQEWGYGMVQGRHGHPLPALHGPICDECTDPATNSWPVLNPPVQLCDSCTHNAFRSGWEPGA